MLQFRGPCDALLRNQVKLSLFLLFSAAVSYNFTHFADDFHKCTINIFIWISVTPPPILCLWFFPLSTPPAASRLSSPACFFILWSPLLVVETLRIQDLHCICFPVQTLSSFWVPSTFCSLIRFVRDNYVVKKQINKAFCMSSLRLVLDPFVKWTWGSAVSIS